MVVRYSCKACVDRDCSRYRDDGNAFPTKHSIFADRVLCSYYKQGDVPPPPKKKPNKKMAALKGTTVPTAIVIGARATAALMLKAMFGTGKEPVDAAAPGGSLSYPLILPDGFGLGFQRLRRLREKVN